MYTLSQVPFWYLIIGIIWSTYQGFRGAIEHRLNCEEYSKKNWKKWEKWLVLYIHDFVFRFVCTIAGFASLFLVYNLSVGVGNGVQSGSEIIIVFLAIVGVIGVGGQLHYVILLGKLPKP